MGHALRKCSKGFKLRCPGPQSRCESGSDPANWTVSEPARPSAFWDQSLKGHGEVKPSSRRWGLAECRRWVFNGLGFLPTAFCLRDVEWRPELQHPHAVAWWRGRIQAYGRLKLASYPDTGHWQHSARTVHRILFEGIVPASCQWIGSQHPARGRP